MSSFVISKSELVKAAGYSNSTLGNDEKLWNTYKRHVGYVAREIAK